MLSSNDTLKTGYYFLFCFADCNEDIPQHIFLTTESKQDQQLQHRFEKRDGNKLPKKKIQKAHQIGKD